MMPADADNVSVRTEKPGVRIDDTPVRTCDHSEMAEPLVSVSCITYNHGKYLRKALDSFMNQRTSFAFEILIHDDASTDDTVQIIREYAEKYPDVIVPMLEEENQYSKGISNISGVFNFPRARGRYIAMCEGDDFWTDNEKLQKQADFMEANPEYSMCCHAAKVVSEDGAFRSESELRPFGRGGELSPGMLISKKINIPTASLFFRTEYAVSLPEWYFSCPVGDIPLQLYMLMKGRVWYLDEIMSAYRMGAEGSWGSGMDAGKAYEKWEKHYSAMKVLYAAFDADTDGRYHEYADEAVRRIRFLVDLKEDKAEMVLLPENALFTGELPEAERRLQVLKAKHRRLYELLRSIYLLVRKVSS